MFCKKCGKEIDEKTSVCPFCGEKININSEPALESMSSEERRKYVELARAKRSKTKVTIMIVTSIVAILLAIAGIGQILDENGTVKEELPIKNMVPLFVLSIATVVLGVFLYIKENNILKNDDKTEELALSLWKEEKAKEKKQEAERIKEEQLKERINEALKPDLNVDKKFEGNNAIVWINTKDLLFQCSLPCGEFTMGKEKVFGVNIPKKIELKKKTKVYSLNDVTDFDLIRSKSEKVVEDVRVYDSTASTTKEKFVNYFFDVEIKLNDLDCPYISVPFGEDEVTAKNFEQVLNILLKK